MSCTAPISTDVLVAYWADDLEQEAASSLEEHLFSCASCAAECERIGAVVRGIRELIPPVVTREQVEALRARGLRVVENPVTPGPRQPCVFGDGVDILLHVLHGLDLSRAETVHVTISDEDTGTVMVEARNVPFDPTTGEVLIACQRHFASFPPNVAFDVRTREASGIEHSTRYLVPHGFASLPDHQ